MIYLALLVVIVTCSAIMDASDYIAKYCLRKGWMNLYDWFNSDSWENKYDLRTWLIKIGIPEGIATWLAKDVLVIFTDSFHLCKAIMFVCMELMVAILSINFVNSVLVNINFPFIFTVGWYTFFLFLSAGQLFNTIYYGIRKYTTK